MKKSSLLQKYFQDLPLLFAASLRALYFLPPIAFAIKRKAKINSRASARGLSHRPVFSIPAKTKGGLAVALCFVSTGHFRCRICVGQFRCRAMAHFSLGEAGDCK